MQFNSYIFILCFLPVTLAGYFVLNRIALKRGKTLTLPNLFLLAMSLWFYAYFNVTYLLLILISIAVNFGLGKCLNGDVGNCKGSKALLALGIVFNTGLIFYFKYYDFFVGNLNVLFRTDFILKHLLLPLGISFFTFQQLSFVIDSYRGETCGYGLIEYALFVSFFPQLVAGPIVLHSELVPQLRDTKRRTPDYENLSTGLMMFTLGLSKKVLIADVLGRCVTWGFANTEGASATDLLFVMFSYTFQIYFDFSGYSDMATGLARMFNLALPQNFNSPYKAVTITDFWTRWHMTLTRFLRKYVYFPLGGSRGDFFVTYRNILIVFLVSGLWHGANWTFVLWGLLHGICQVIERIFARGMGTVTHLAGTQAGDKGDGSVLSPEVQGDKQNRPQLSPKRVSVPVPLTHLRRAATFLIVNVLWLLFRADSVSQWAFILNRMVTSRDFYIHEDAVRAFKVPGLVSAVYGTGLWYPQRKIYAICGLIFLLMCLLICLLTKNNFEREYRMEKKSLAWCAGLMVLCLISLSTVSVFLYFNF